MELFFWFDFGIASTRCRWQRTAFANANIITKFCVALSMRIEISNLHWLKFYFVMTLEFELNLILKLESTYLKSC